MAGRPSLSTPNGATVRITVPPEWFLSASAVSIAHCQSFCLFIFKSKISRKRYQQVVYFQSDLKSGRNFVTYTFRQDDTNILGPMIDATGGDTSFGLAGQQDPYNLDISTYFSDPNKVTIKTIRTPPYASSSFDISTVCILIYFTFVTSQRSSLSIVN